jgi:hypothetical protein
VCKTNMKEGSGIGVGEGEGEEGEGEGEGEGESGGEGEGEGEGEDEGGRRGRRWGLKRKKVEMKREEMEKVMKRERKGSASQPTLPLSLSSSHA